MRSNRRGGIPHGTEQFLRQRQIEEAREHRSRNEEAARRVIRQYGAKYEWSIDDVATVEMALGLA